MADFTDHIQQVSDPATRRALEAILGAVRTDLNSINNHLAADGIITAATLSEGSTTANVATTAFTYRIDGMPYAKAAVAAGTAPAAATINTGAATGTFYGGFALQINAAGTISTLPGSGDQVHESAADAYAAALAITPTAGNVIAGYFVVGAAADSAWVGGTDDLDGDGTSDSSYVAYYSVPSTLPVLTFTE